MRFTYLVLRGSKFYFQCRIPADVKRFFPCTQIKKSLKTTNPKQAASLVKGLTAKTERLFFMARSGLLTAKMIESLVQEYFDTLLDADKRERYGVTETDLDVTALQLRDEFRDQFKMDHRKDYQLLDGETGEVEEVSGARNLAMYYRALASRYTEQARRQDHSEISPIAATLLAIEKLQASENSPDFKMFCDALLAKEIEANEVLAQRAERGLSNPYDLGAGSVTPRRKKLTVLMDKYCEVHEGHGGKSGKRKVREQFDKILELTGNPYTDDLSQDMLVELFNDLAKYPQYRNHAHFKNLTIEQCREHPKYKPLGSTTIEQIWYALGSLLTYGSENGSYGIARNYCCDKIFAVRKKAVQQTNTVALDRLPYGQNDIQNLINELGKIRKAVNPHLLWIPLIALFSGMRQNEICQLYCDDFVLEGGVHCFRLRDFKKRYQSVKNEQSRRTIPIHPTLLNLGLMEFIGSRRKLNAERPWEGGTRRRVKYYESSDNYSHELEKWYNGTFRKYVVTEEEDRKKKPFHSLRHTFINWFFQNIRSNERDNSAVKGLVGHLETDEQKLIEAMHKGVTWETYTQELNPKKMMETLRLLDYSVDLCPLGLPAKW